MNKNDHIDRLFGRSFRERCRQGAMTRRAKPVDPKSKWAKFSVGQSVPLKHPYAYEPHVFKVAVVKVAEIRADGLLLRGKDLPQLAGKLVRVNGVACKVDRITSKGMYVRGA